MHSPTAVPVDFSPLRALRTQMHVSRAELAAKIGVNYTTIWRWEKGVFDPTLGLLLATARALGVPTTDLFRVLK